MKEEKGRKILKANNLRGKKTNLYPLANKNQLCFLSKLNCFLKV